MVQEHPEKTAPIDTITPPESVTDSQANTILTRFSPPSGFKRISVEYGSFEEYLRNLPLKPIGSPVFYFDGTQKPVDVHEAVVDIDVGKRDLQQCADAIMRLRAEYLWHNHRHEDISFNFTNGFPAQYSKWKSGKAIQVKGNQVNWISSTRANDSYKSFRKYLDMVFSYAGTQSLEKELKAQNWENIEIGDVLIQGGFPGHAVVVVDLVENPDTKEKRFLLAQSYMPAQEIHVLKNPMRPAMSPWYSVRTPGSIRTPEWTFQRGDLKLFE